MSPGLLALVAVVQGFVLLLGLCALLCSHVGGRRRDGTRRRELERGRAILRDVTAGDRPHGSTVEALDELRPGTLSVLLGEVASQRGGSGGEAAIELLRRTRWHDRICRQARSRLWWRRLGAARALADLAAPGHLLLIHELLDDPAPAIRLAAASALERLPSPGLASAVLDRAVASHAVVRGQLIEILASSRTLVVPVMVDRLMSPASDEELRVLLDLCAILGYPSLLTHVVPHGDSASIEVRIAVATCLRNFPHPQAAGVLRRLLADREWQVRARAAASLGAIGAVEAGGELLGALCDANWWVRLRAAIALRLLGPGGVIALRAVDRGGDPYASDMARYVLGLDDGAMAEYVGGATTDFLTAPSGALAG